MSSLPAHTLKPFWAKRKISLSFYFFVKDEFVLDYNLRRHSCFKNAILKLLYNILEQQLHPLKDHTVFKVRSDKIILVTERLMFQPGPAHWARLSHSLWLPHFIFLIWRICLRKVMFFTVCKMSFILLIIQLKLCWGTWGAKGAHVSVFADNSTIWFIQLSLKH